MKKPISKVGTLLIILATVILAGIAIFTAFRLYQLRQQPVAPNAPSSLPKAAENSNCQLSFEVSSTSTETPTATPTSTATATASPTATPTVTPSSTPTANPSATPNSCNGTCGSDANCLSGYYFCYQGYCRDKSCPDRTDCTCPKTNSPAPTGTSSPSSLTKVSSPAPTEASLPVSGVNWPTLVGAGVGILVIISSILLAL